MPSTIGGQTGPLGANCGRRKSGLKSFSIRQQSDVDVILDGDDDFIHTYTTFDEIKGRVNIRFDRDTTITDMNIVFQGQTDAWVERIASVSPRAGRATAKHVFLRMLQPIETTPFAINNTAKAGVTYSVPFMFVVPDQLLPFVCNHASDSDGVKVEHLRLPPSIGDEMLSGEGSVLMDDLAPAMSKVVYSIRVRIAKVTAPTRPAEIVEGSTRVRIIPAREESPPLSLDPARPQCEAFKLRSEKNVRKGILGLGKKQGRMVAETTQPKSLRLQPPNTAFQKPVTTMTTLNLRYDPVLMDEQPPQLGSVATKIKAYTFFGGQPFRFIPGADNHDVFSVMHGSYSMTVDLSTMCLSSVQWTKHEPEQDAELTAASQSMNVANSHNTTVRARKLSTSTGTESLGSSLPRRGTLNRVPSDLSSSSRGSDSSEESNTTCSAPGSPTLTTSFFQKPVTISPSTAYNEALPYYTASIVVPITLPHAPSRRPPTTVVDTVTSAGDASASFSTTPGVKPSNPQASPSSILPASIRRRGNPTFLPTFHNCLISRTYTLELVLSTSSTAPNITLKTPIEITCEHTQQSSSSLSQLASSSQQQRQQQQRQTQRQFSSDGKSFDGAASLSAPREWYDPFSLDQIPSYATSQEEHQQQQRHEGFTEEDTANDDAIARALASSSSSSSYPYVPPPMTRRTQSDLHEREGETVQNEQIPSYTEQPHAPPSLSSSQPPNAPINDIQQNQNSSLSSSPPEYYSSFRRATITNISSSPAPVPCSSQRRNSERERQQDRERTNRRLSNISRKILRI